MRLSSMFFALIFAPLALSAQSAAGDSSPTRIERQRQALDQLQHIKQQMQAAALTCPVRLSVNRVATGAVIWTNGESDWFDAHSTLSLPELKRSLKSEPGFSQLSPQDQQHRLDQLAQLYHMRHGQGQGLDITFTGHAARTSPSQIVSADITVRGYPPTTHVIPATPSLPAEVTEIFHLAADSGKPLLHSSVWTERIIMINWVELTRVEFADGTSWQSSTPRQCGAAPSLYLPVTNGR